jgi:hypothetical protein
MTIRSTRAAPALLLAAIGVSACEGGMMSPFTARTTTETFLPITSEQMFREQVVGREVVYANGAVGAYGADGTWTITQGDARIGGGTWTWEEDRWCREGATSEGPVPAACEAVEISGASIRFTRADGVQGTLPFRG